MARFRDLQKMYSDCTWHSGPCGLKCLQKTRP
jgi:hypothetical protein